MKKVLCLVLSLVLLSGFVAAQETPEASNPSTPPSASNFLGYNLAGMIVSGLAGIYSLPLDYQHAFTKWGIDVGAEYATNDLMNSLYYSPKVEALSIAAGPVYFFSGKGVAGFFARARVSTTVVTATYKGASQTATALGFDTHVGYNIILPSMMPGCNTTITPFAGLMVGGSTPAFNWGLNMGAAF